MNDVRDKVDYCIYRMTKFYVDIHPKDKKSGLITYREGGFLFGMCIVGQLYALFDVIGFASGVNFRSLQRYGFCSTWSYVRLTTTLFCFVFMFFASKAKYLEQHRKHKNDPLAVQKHKGRKVLFFFIVSFLLPAITSGIFSRLN